MHNLWIQFKRSNRLSYQAMSSSHSQSQLCRATPISSLCSVFMFHFSLCSRQSPHLLEAKSRTGNHVVVEWIDKWGIHHWRIFRSRYRKLVRVGFEPTTTEFPLGAPTSWAIRQWVQVAVRANFVQLLQFHLFVQYLRFILVFAFISCLICYRWSLAQVTTL